MRKYVEAAFGGWDEAAQRRDFDARLQLPTHEILERDGRAIGCLSTAQLPDAIALHRVYLLPEAQGQGLGSALVREVIARGAALGLPVRLRVFKTNPAHELYRRLGFAVIGESETHFQMERAARVAAGAALVRDGRVLLGLRSARPRSLPGRVGRVRRSLRGQRVAARGVGPRAPRGAGDRAPRLRSARELRRLLPLPRRRMARRAREPRRRARRDRLGRPRPSSSVSRSRRRTTSRCSPRCSRRQRRVGERNGKA